jgi:hypothetical protein
MNSSHRHDPKQNLPRAETEDGISNDCNRVRVKTDAQICFNLQPVSNVTDNNDVIPEKIDSHRKESDDGRTIDFKPLPEKIRSLICSSFDPGSKEMDCKCEQLTNDDLSRFEIDDGITIDEDFPIYR